MIAGITNSEISILRTFLGPEKKFARRRKKIRRHEEKKNKGILRHFCASLFCIWWHYPNIKRRYQQVNLAYISTRILYRKLDHHISAKTRFWVHRRETNGIISFVCDNRCKFIAKTIKLASVKLQIALECPSKSKKTTRRSSNRSKAMLNR